MGHPVQGRAEEAVITFWYRWKSKTRSSYAIFSKANAHRIASPLLTPLAQAIMLSVSSISGDISTVMLLMMHLHRSTFDKNYTALFLLALLEKKQTRGVAS
jgi:hypothetical protein